MFRAIGIFVLMTVGSVVAADENRNLAVVPAKAGRIALVIGNAAYPGVAALKNPANDAADIAAKLRKLNFDVTLKVNVGLKEMLRALTAFGNKVQPGGEVVVFYAGHGMQVRGKNYLIPIDAEIGNETAVSSESVDVDQLLDKLAAARLSMVILDACRNNPFEKSFRGGGQGLASINAPTGTLIAYATAPGKVASDGEGKNGLYTQELLAAMDVPGLKVEDVFKRVRANVVKRTQDAQTPWESSSLTGDFYFVPESGELPPSHAGSSPAAASARTPQQIEDELWESIKDSNKASVFSEYLNGYPKGRYVTLAKVRLANLKQSAQPQAPQTVPAGQAGARPAITNTSPGMDEARRLILRGAAAAETAKSNSELADAAQEFRKATEIAPALPDAWFNLAVVQAKLGQYSEAIAAYRRYADLAPSAQDAQKVRGEIVKLEYQQERAAKRDKLIGSWSVNIPTGFAAGPQFRTETYKVTINGAEFRMEPLSTQWLRREFKLYTPDPKSGGKLVPLLAAKVENPKMIFLGRLDGDRIAGERLRQGFYDPESKCRIGDHRTPFEGRFDASEETLLISFDEPRFRGIWDYKSYLSSSNETECLRTETDPPERQEFRMTRAKGAAATGLDPFFDKFLQPKQ